MNPLRCILLLLLSGLIAPALRAANISGTITDAHTGQPVAGLHISIADSANAYFTAGATTNAAGQYTATIPATVPIWMPVTVTAPACGVPTKVVFSYNGGNITGANLAVCTGNALYNLQGFVSLDGAANGGAIRLRLLQRVYNAALLDTVWAPIDSFTTTNPGGYFNRSYVYTQIGGGPTLLQASLAGSHPRYREFMPTYYVSAITWRNADTFTPVTLITDTFRIAMARVFDTSGRGSIGGAVISGAGKSSGLGDPLPGRILLLTNSANVPIGFTYSDSAGRYRFDSLALGTYKIFGDAVGKSNPALTVTITNSKPSLTDILFTETSKVFAARIGGVGVGTTAGLPDDVVPFPNPAESMLSFSGLGSFPGEKSLTLSDMRGIVLMYRHFKTGQAVALRVATLPAGIYMIRLQTEHGVGSFRMIKK